MKTAGSVTTSPPLCDPRHQPAEVTDGNRRALQESHLKLLLFVESAFGVGFNFANI